MDMLELHRKAKQRFKSLDTEAENWRPHWREIAEYMLTAKGRFLSGDETPNRGEKRMTRVIDGTAQRALVILAAGMQGGLTSPARPWFKLGLQDKERAEFGPARAWLDDVRKRMLMVLNASNFYTSIHGIYSELGAFGTGAMTAEPDFEDVARFRVFTVGEYMLGCGGDGRINAFARKCKMTAGQVVGMFGWDNVSARIKSLCKNGGQDTWVDVHHLIAPRESFDWGKADNKNMPWASYYWETGAPSTENTNPFLRESGYRKYPIFAPRWDVTGSDIYGRSPGMDVLPDTKMLQKMQEKGLVALDKMIDPPMVGSPTLEQRGGATIIPGGITFVDPMQGGQGFAPAYQINPDFKAIEYKIERVQAAIREGFFNDLFLMLAGESKQMTATEVAERHEEKLLMIGPVLERVQSELLDPIIDRTFELMYEAGLIPPAPPDLQGVELEVEYVSLLAQAQKLVGTTAIEQTAAFVGNLTAVYPEARHKFNALEAIDQYSDMTGVSSGVIRSDEETQAIIEAEKQAAQMAQAAEQAAATAQSAKVMSETQIGTNSALDALLGPGAGGLR